jgi:hypothetical protein
VRPRSPRPTTPGWCSTRWADKAHSIARAASAGQYQADVAAGAADAEASRRVRDADPELTQRCDESRRRMPGTETNARRIADKVQGPFDDRCVEFLDVLHDGSCNVRLCS